MSTALRVVPATQPEVTALTNTCEALAKNANLDRFEIAVKQRVAQGIHDDQDLRLTDEMLAAVMRGADAVDASAKPATSAAHALHKALVAEANSWKGRWTSMADSLKSTILAYNRAKRELAERQQRELERAAEQERQRKQSEARAAMRSGDVAGAKAAMQEAEMVVTPVIVTSAPVLDNSSTRRPWQVEITDPEAVIKAIAAGIIPVCAIKEWDLSFLKKEVTRRGGLPPNWAGLQAWQDEKLTVRR